MDFVKPDIVGKKHMFRLVTAFDENIWSILTAE